MTHILIVDDEKDLCEALSAFLEDEGHTVQIAANGDEALRIWRESPPNLTLMDFRMPGQTGLEVLEKMRESDPNSYIVLMTAYGTSQTSIDAKRLGAFDYITKPLDLDVIKPLVERALAEQHASSKEDNRATESESEEIFLAGNSPAMLETYKLIGMLSSNDALVLITGERGTGKQSIAKTIHHNSQRSTERFTTVFCHTLSEEEVGTELFGAESGIQGKGGEITARGGLETASGGSVYIARIDSLSPLLQARLLRFLEDGHFERIGGIGRQASDVRIIASAEQDLSQRVSEGTFNPELYNKLCPLQIHLPPLRERGVDLPELTQFFINRFNRELNRSIRKVDEEVEKLFEGYAWPGNLEEMKQVMQRACLLAPGEVIAHQEIGSSLWGNEPAFAQNTNDRLKDAAIFALHQSLKETGKSATPAPYKEIVSKVESVIVEEALRMTSGNQLRAAEILGLNRTTLRSKLRP